MHTIEFDDEGVIRCVHIVAKLIEECPVEWAVSSSAEIDLVCAEQEEIEKLLLEGWVGNLSEPGAHFSLSGGQTDFVYEGLECRDYIIIIVIGV